MTVLTIPFKQALDEWCDINILAVIIEKLSFGDAMLADTIWGKNSPNLRLRPKFSRRPHTSEIHD